MRGAALLLCGGRVNNTTTTTPHETQQQQKTRRTCEEKMIFDLNRLEEPQADGDKHHGSSGEQRGFSNNKASAAQ
jgi:hypothetical protein